MPFDCGSTTPSTALAAMTASTALPPRSSICTPARAASGWLAATMPYVVATRDRPTVTLMPSSYPFLLSRCDRVHELNHGDTETQRRAGAIRPGAAKRRAMAELGRMREPI